MSKDTSILIPAAGAGERLGMGPKALLQLEGKTLIHWVTRVALQYSDDVLVSYPQGYLDTFASICPQCRFIEGGRTRQQSIEKLLHASSGKWLVIADVVRPFISGKQIEAVVAEARAHGLAGLFLEPDVPIATIHEGRIEQLFRKENVGILQSPQAFSRDILLDVYEQAGKEQWEEQSTLQLALKAGYAASALAGSKCNIKLTSEEDWELARRMAKNRLK
jgi:2-C-methyl-D-erythritol 4-phosphate cytidylyltransferase